MAIEKTKTNELQFGVKNVRYAIFNQETKTYGAPKDLAYADSISLEATLETTKIYGDGEVIAELVADSGLTGTLTLVQPAEEYEKDLKRRIDVEIGTGNATISATAEISQIDNVEHAIYYETNALIGGVNQTIKVWLLNLTASKPDEKRTQSNPSPNVENIEYTLTILGDYLKDSVGTSIYLDDNGNSVRVYKVVCKPSDTNYDKFEDSVPSVKSPAISDPGL
jgi:phi13 family phage major tail protein